MFQVTFRFKMMHELAQVIYEMNDNTHNSTKYIYFNFLGSLTDRQTDEHKAAE